MFWRFRGLLFHSLVTHVILQSDQMFLGVTVRLCKLPPQCSYFDWQCTNPLLFDS